MQYVPRSSQAKKVTYSCNCTELLRCTITSNPPRACGAFHLHSSRFCCNAPQHEQQRLGLPCPLLGCRWSINPSKNPPQAVANPPSHAPGPRPRTLSSFSPWPRQVRLLSIRPTPAALSCRSGRIHTNFLPIIFSFRPHPHPSLTLHSPPAHIHLHAYLTDLTPPLPLPDQPIYRPHKNEVSTYYYHSVGTYSTARKIHPPKRPFRRLGGLRSRTG